MKTYSFSYINIYGNGSVVEVKEFASDSEAMSHGQQLINGCANDEASRTSWCSDFQSPEIVIDKWDDGYPEENTFGTEDEVEPMATASIVAEFSATGDFVKYITNPF